MRKVKQIRLLLILVIFAITSVLLTSCYPDYGLGVEDFDIVSTFKDDANDFQLYRTFFMADTIDKITDGGIEPSAGENDELILSEIEKQMIAYGYTRTLIPDSADVTLQVAISSTAVFSYYPGYWGGYYGWYYPWYGYGGYSYSYTSGSIFVTMIDNDKFDETTKNIGAVWAGILNGVLDYSSNTELRVRIVDGIAKMFSQSPYLKIYP